MAAPMPTGIPNPAAGPPDLSGLSPVEAQAVQVVLQSPRAMQALATMLVGAGQGPAVPGPQADVASQLFGGP